MVRRCVRGPVQVETHLTETEPYVIVCLSDKVHFVRAMVTKAALDEFAKYAARCRRRRRRRRVLSPGPTATYSAGPRPLPHLRRAGRQEPAVPAH